MSNKIQDYVDIIIEYLYEIGENPYADYSMFNNDYKEMVKDGTIAEIPEPYRRQAYKIAEKKFSDRYSSGNSRSYFDNYDDIDDDVYNTNDSGMEYIYDKYKNNESLSRNLMDSKMEVYAASIYDYLIGERYNYGINDYNKFKDELQYCIDSGEIMNIPDEYREKAFKLAIGKLQLVPDYDKVIPGNDMEMESLIKDTNEMITRLSESLASKKAKKLGLVHIGFGNYASEPGAKAEYKTINGKLRAMSGADAPERVDYTQKDKPKNKDIDDASKSKKKYKDHTIKNVRRVSGEKYTYEFEKDGRTFKFTLNKKERKELKGKGSIMMIIKNRLKVKELNKKAKQFSKGQHVDANQPIKKDK